MLIRWTSLFFLAVGSLCSDLPDNQFQTLNYGNIVEQLYDLATNYPHLAKVYSAQDRYQLPSPGSCSEDGSVECEQWVLHISDHTTLEADPERPEVFFSGCLHGDEQVGPTAIMETAKLMVYAAMCHADSSAKECDNEVLRAAPESVQWLARLALTRSTVIMPMTNSIGYHKTVRTENGLDPNRDFPYHQKPEQCMTTITARAVNEVWREHAFQLAVTFHGGMVAVAYEWGSPDHPHKVDKSGNWQDVSPDHAAQEELTAGLSQFSGGFKDGGKTFKAYPTGRMNELVYPVSGGMEDWAYAGSWGDAMGACEPTANGGYPKEKTIYNSATLRALNILVEASDLKRPRQSLLGSRQGLLESIPSREEHANGHVARNVRLSLMVVDLVEPYVEWAPLTRAAIDGAGVVVVDEELGVDLEWTVGGAFEVDTTQLIWGPWPENSDTLTRRDWEDLAAAASVQNQSPAQSGRSRWKSSGDDDKASSPTTFRARFYLDLDLDLVKPPDGVGLRLGEGKGAPSAAAAAAAAAPAFVVAVTTVDQEWGSRLVKGWPDIGPQSHFVNARTSEDWLQENEGHIVRGRLQWLSVPLKVVTATATAPPEPPGHADVNNNTKGDGGQVGLGGGSVKGTATPRPLSPAAIDNKTKRDDAPGVLGGGDAEGTAAPFEMGSPSDVSKEGETMNIPALVVMAVMMASLAVAAFVMRTRGVRLGGGGGGGTMAGRQRGGLRGVSQDPDRRQSGGVALGLGKSGDVVSRRRSQEIPSARGRGHSGTRDQSESTERRGLLSPIGET